MPNFKDNNYQRFTHYSFYNYDYMLIMALKKVNSIDKHNSGVRS